METDLQDSVAFCIKALETGANKELALAQAKIAHVQWLSIDISDILKYGSAVREVYNLRSIVFATVATIYVWNNCTALAYEMESEFLFDDDLWHGRNKQSIDLYLIFLMIQKQADHLNKIFENDKFKTVFLEYEDVYLSSVNPHYTFKSKMFLFTKLVNRINSYCQKITGNKLM